MSVLFAFLLALLGAHSPDPAPQPVAPPAVTSMSVARAFASAGSRQDHRRVWPAVTTASHRTPRRTARTSPRRASAATVVVGRGSTIPRRSSMARVLPTTLWGGVAIRCSRGPS